MSAVLLICTVYTAHFQEYYENGPLFSELKFYQRAAKPDTSKILCSFLNLNSVQIL